MFCLSFLVAFPKKTNQKPTRKAKPEKKAKPSTAPKESEPPLHKPLEIGMKSTCAIKYNLFDGFQYQVDVCSWGQPGKVYAGGDSRAVRCLQTEKLSVVCFSVYHAFAQLKFVQDDIIKLLNQSLSFKFFDNKTQMSAGAQKDAPKYFYDSNETSDKISFAFINEGKTANGPDNITIEEKVTFESLYEEAQSINGRVHSKLRGKPIGLHQKKLLDVIKSLDDKVASDTALVKGGSRKSGRSTAKSKDNNTITFSCTELLLDELMIYHQKIKPAKQIEFVAVIVSAKDIMLEEIRQSLFPFSVEIKHLQHLPPSKLSLTHIFLKYSLESVFSQETEKIEITQDNYQYIEFNYSKVLFVNRMNLPFSVFVEALQTGLFCIEVYGVPSAEADKKDTHIPQKEINGGFETLETTQTKKIKKLKSKKESRSKKGHKNDKIKPNVLLAVAYVNLCDMVKSILWTDYNIHLTTNFPYESWWVRRQDETIPQAEKHDKPERVTPYFTQKDLIECGTIIKIRLRNGDLIQPLLLANILSEKEAISRIIIVFHENDNNNVIWDTVNIQNKAIDGRRDTLTARNTPDSLMSFRNEFSSVISDDLVDINYISGFLIDTLDKKFLMAEGLSNFKFTKILGIISRLKNYKNVKILYNSSFVFTERLYPDPNQKIVNIVKLKTPLSSFVRLPYNVLKRKVPHMVLKAIMKLESILKCYTMLEVCVQKLFLSPEEISALELKLGARLSRDDFGTPIIQKLDYTS